MIGISYSPWYSAHTEEGAQRVVDAWKDAPLTNVEVLRMLLDVALEQVIEYAPESFDDFFQDSAPSRYVWAQLQQAKSLWNAGRVQASGEVGSGEFSFVPRPLSKEIQKLIRPEGGVVNVF